MNEDLPYDAEAHRRTTDPSMHLPAGRRCFDCIRFAGCRRFFSCRAEAVVCDWAPSQFVSRDPLTPGAK